MDARMVESENKSMSEINYFPLVKQGECLKQQRYR